VPIVGDVPPSAPPDEINSLWQRVRAELAESLPPSTFKLWLDPLRAVSAQGTTLYLAAPEGVRNWVERRYASHVIAVLRRHAPELDSIDFVAERERDPSGGPSEPAGPQSLPVASSHRFDRFVIGPGNRLAHSAALAVAELPGEAYNPLFLHGPPGLGKTHLLGAIAAYMRHNHPGLNVHYTTAERFTAEFVSSLRAQGPDRFKARYRELDALLIDDVQVLEGKERTEEEFVHTFNALHAAGKQIVLSSDRPPEALSRLAERLRDRFAWGLIVRLDPPDLRTRIALLWRIASASALELPDPAALRAIAARTPANVRLLEGAMTRVLAVASMLGEPLTPPLVDRALGREAAEAGRSRHGAPSLTAIQDAVCAVLGIERSELLSARRTPRVAQARQLAMYLARDLTSSSLAEIARAFDRDHTTVLHAVRAVEGRLEPGSDTESHVNRVRLTLGDTEGTGGGEPPGPPIPGS
jgi:chromosomal replication initiator protein